MLLKQNNLFSQGKPGTASKHRRTQLGQRNDLTPKTRPSKNKKVKNPEKSRQPPSFPEIREGQQNVGSSYLFTYT